MHPDLRGGPGVAPDWIDVDISTALFRVPDNNLYLLHVHASFPRSRLLFLRDEVVIRTEWRAAFEWRVIIRSRNALQIGGGIYSDEVALNPGELPEDPGIYIRAHQQFMIPAGRYRIEVIVSDRNSVRSGRVVGEVEAFSFRPDEPGLSQIEILDPEIAIPSVRVNEPPQSTGDHSKEVLASFSNPEDADVVGFYFEAYHIPHEVAAVYRLLSDTGHEVRSRRRMIPSGALIAVRDTMAIEGLVEGTYSLQLTIEDLGTAGLREHRAVRLCRPLLAWGDDLKITAAQLSLYTDESTVERFRSIPENRRRAFLDSLWHERDPTPGTRRNELQEEFIRRLRYADDNWRIGQRRGWDVDIGRIYIAYGEPDEVIHEGITNPAENPLEEPQQLIVRKWIYREPPVIFVFVYERDRGWMLSPDSPTPIPPVQ